MMKVFVVVGNEGHGVQGVFANEADAKKFAEYQTWCWGCEGSHAHAWVEEHEVAEKLDFDVEM